MSKQKPKPFHATTKEYFVDHPDIGAGVWRHDYQPEPRAPKQYHLRITEKTWRGNRVVIDQFYPRSPERFQAMMGYLNPRYEALQAKAKGRVELAKMRRDNRKGIFLPLLRLLNGASKAACADFRGPKIQKVEITPWDV